MTSEQYTIKGTTLMLELLLNSSFLSSVIAFAIILIPAIIIHEFGHFIAARMVGINVLEFGIGFPPRILRLFTWGETEFTLNWLPIGGFVRPLGEDMLGPTMPEDSHSSTDDNEKAKHDEYISEREELLNRGVPEDKLLSVNEAKPLSRIFFMAAGAIANVLSAIVVFIIAAMIGIPVEVGARMQIAELPDQSLFPIPAVSVDDAVERINGELFRSHVEFFALLQQQEGQEVIFTMRHPEDFPDADLAGESYEVVGRVSSGQPEPFIFISYVMENTPGFDAGLAIGDKIVAIAGRSLDLTDPVTDMQTAAAESAGQPLQISVLRDGERLEFTLVPRETVAPGEGRIGVRISAHYGLSDGVVFRHTDGQVEIVPQNLSAAVGYGFNRIGEIFRLIAAIPGQLLSGAVTPEQARPVSIVGISQIGGQFLQQSIRDGSPAMILEFLGLISVFLGVTNMLPLPPLDGGRILFVLIEMLRGKPVPPQIEYNIHRIGIALLLSLGVIIIVYDIINPLA